MQLFERNTDPAEKFQEIQFRERSMIHEIGVNRILEIPATEIGKEDVDCFCPVAFLQRSVVLPLVSARMS